MTAEHVDHPGRDVGDAVPAQSGIAAPRRVVDRSDPPLEANT